jgi:hypothetical protein
VQPAATTRKRTNTLLVLMNGLLLTLAAQYP